MAAAPTFAGTPRINVVAVSTANTNRDGTGTVANLGAIGASGSLLDRIVMKATADPADSIVTVFLHDGSAFWLFDEFDLGNPAAGSTTVEAYREERFYSYLPLPASWTVRAAITVALTAGQINAFAILLDI